MQNIEDNDGNELRAGLISKRWEGHFGQLLNTMPPTLEWLAMADKVKQRPTCVQLDDTKYIPPLLEGEEAIRGITNRKAVGPDDLLA